MSDPSPFSAVATPPSWTTLARALAGIALLWLPVLWLHLVPALFAALLTYIASRALAGQFQRRWPRLAHPDGAALLVIVLLLVVAVAGVAEGVTFARRHAMDMSAVIQQMADTLERLRSVLPTWLAERLPESIDALRSSAAQWLREHAGTVKGWGGGMLRGVGHVLAGTVVGALAALQLPVDATAHHAPLAIQLRLGFDELLDRFSSVVLAQVRIAALNTVLTALFLLGLLPLFGTPLPLAKTLTALTFVASLLPVIGNLLSNTMIVVVALSQGLGVATLALAWLVGIHKLEYFMNAHIIGSRIRAQAWELLVAMLLMEATFGLAGLVCAPVLYAQIKHTLLRRGWLD